MKIITKKISKKINKKNLSRNKLAQLINYDFSNLNKMINGNRHFTNEIIEKLLPILEVSREEFEGWILADKYSKETLNLAIKAKKEKRSQEDKLIVTLKIDEILKNKNISRTTLSKLMKRSQSGLNRIIIGKETFSDKAIKEIAPILEVSEDEIRAWILADKSSFQALETATILTKNTEIF